VSVHGERIIPARGLDGPAGPKARQEVAVGRALSS
jgi:hypothetical protein